LGVGATIVAATSAGSVLAGGSTITCDCTSAFFKIVGVKKFTGK